jgi:hypothetical protein
MAQRRQRGWLKKEVAFRVKPECSIFRITRKSDGRRGAYHNKRLRPRPEEPLACEMGQQNRAGIEPLEIEEWLTK